MTKPFVIRYGWLRLMYLYTILGAGAMGVGIVTVPEAVRAAFRWPADEPISVLRAAERKKAVAFRFRLFEGENLALSFDEVLSLTADDWQRYQRVCRDALTCRKTRNWPSNVTI